jgi:hypothetical protein
VNFLKEFIRKHPFAAAAAATSILFSIAICFLHFTLSADDFGYLARLYSNDGLRITDFFHFIDRTPVWIFFAWIFFHLPDAESGRIPFIVTFVIFSFSVARLFSYFAAETRLNLNPWKAFWITSVLLLYPTHYEILYWLTAMSYIAGLGLWALSLGAVTFLQIPLMASAFLVSEAYLLPVLLFPFLIQIANGQLGFKNAAREILKWLVAVGLFFGIRFVIRHQLDLPAYAYDISLNPGFILGRIRDSFYEVYAIQFYKVYWANTAIYWLILLALLFIAFKNRLASPVKVMGCFAVSFLATAIYWIYAHNAPRALFGAQILVCVAIFYLLSFFELKKLKWFLTLLACVYLSATAKIFSVKWKNHQVLEALEVDWTNRLSACPEPCVIEVKDLDKDIRNDWVMDYQSSWPGFIDYVISKHKITKKIEPIYVKPTK